MQNGLLMIKQSCKPSDRLLRGGEVPRSAPKPSADSLKATAATHSTELWGQAAHETSIDLR